ncbi:hypothetical protein J4H91_02035 [Leucobacter ruminantium]|uniref:Uncharacterized protein n=1 Tax=Leucobacter ruminantium TaxID=1289170 RepID=A0A939RVL9_9MICO|nr:hypothetical protein [Leucobacter ruminantium]
MPARERLAYEQAERVKTAPLPKAKAEKPVKEKKPAKAKPAAAADPRIAKAKPWIVVGIVTVVALVASILVLNFARAGQDPSPTAEPTTQAPATSAPATSKPADDDSEKKKKPAADEVPSVDVGNTGTMDVPVWGITAQISEKFGWPQYQINGEQLVLQYSPLIDSLPDSCAAMRQQWGIQRTADGKYEVLKPAQRCEAAPELYDELWGLTDALVKSIAPL